MSEKTIHEWTDEIRGLIKQTEQDGYEVWINNRCCGCSKMTLCIGPEEDDGISSVIFGEE